MFSVVAEVSSHQSHKEDFETSQKNYSPLLRPFFNISIICLKFAIKLASLLLGQSSCFKQPKLYFVFRVPLTWQHLICSKKQ